MPCSAPCDRVPCDERCQRNLRCGHQCPSLCGEACPEGYCIFCSDRREARVDLLEMKQYDEINLDETPIVVLGCGHFFTAETLDGHMGMGEVYVQDQRGVYTELKDTSTALARSIPRCPDCQCPVRQYCTQRFNRVINRAVIDEMSKRFLVTGKTNLRELEEQIASLSQDFENTRALLVASISNAGEGFSLLGVTQTLKKRKVQAQELERAVNVFNKSVMDKHQPAQKLHEATINAMRRQPVEDMMANLSMNAGVPEVARDRRVTVGGRLARLQAKCIILVDRFDIAATVKATKAAAGLAKLAEHNPEKETKGCFQFAEILIRECFEESLPKFGVEGSLYYARLARANESYCRSIKHQVTEASAHVVTAKEFLQKAQELCKRPFQNSEALGAAVDESIKILGREWYEEVTAGELAAIKAAMVSGAGGMNTHSGHWYNCVNGHPVSLIISPCSPTRG